MTVAFMSIQKMTLAEINKIVSRMIQAAGAKDQQEMIRKTGLSDGVVSKWKKRGRVSESGILKVAQMTGARHEWLLSGTGPMLVNATSAGQTPAVLDPTIAESVDRYLKKGERTLSERQVALLALFDQLDQTDQSEAITLLAIMVHSR